MVIIVDLRINTVNEYVQLAETTDSGELQLHCNDYYDLLLFNGPIGKESIQFLTEHFKQGEEIAIGDSDDYNVNYVMIPCSCGSSSQIVLNYIMQNHGIQTAPIKYSAGWEYYEFFCINKQSLSSILSILKEKYTLELISVEEQSFYYNPMRILGVSLIDILQRLNPRQIKLLKEVYLEGYYDIPRKVKLAEIADRMGKSRWTIEKSIRQIENKIMDMVVPLIDFGVLNRTQIMPNTSKSY